MKTTIALLLALAVPMSATNAAAVLTDYSDNTNLVEATHNAADSPFYRLPDMDNPANPFVRAAANNEPDHHHLASADDNYLMLAEIAGPGDELLFMDEDDEILEVFDPLETVNRGMFWFNDKLYFYLMKPIARGYRFIVPEPVRVSVGKFFTNLRTPVRMINAGLQGKFAAAGTELGRFGLNSTIGILGFFDPADSYFDLKKTDEDTGQTLGFHGVGPGPYLVLPFIGPSSLRDGLGLLADSQMDIMTHLLEHQDYWGTLAFRAINTLSLDKDTYEGIKKDALDPYLFVRDAWTQYRQNLVEN